MSRPFPCLAFLALCACGGADVPLTTPPPATGFDGQLARGTRLAESLGDLSPTRFTAMPTTGTATFTGVASLFIDPVEATDADDIVVLGDMTATADFALGTLRGQVDNLNGATAFTSNGYGEIPVGGRLQIGARDSVVGNDADDNRTSRPNDFYADYRGQITLADGTYAVDGTIDGQFIGTRTADGVMPIRGLAGFGEGVAIRGTEGTADFVEYGADLEIVGRTPARP